MGALKALFWFLLTEEEAKKRMIAVIRAAAEKTDTKIDDKIVDGIEAGLGLIDVKRILRG